MAHALSYEFHRRRRLSMMATGSLSSSSSFFPSSHELIVTTNEGVYSWTSEGVGQVFSSGSGGIVGAKRTGSQRGLLAVADSQVVILHDVNQGMRHSYRLKGTEGCVRHLQYATDSERLFFTTSLQNAVQIYSLYSAKLLDPSHTHPSPPTVFALSANSQLLLSASASPPTIYIANTTSGSTPVLLQTNCSTSPAMAAAFHPYRHSLFALGFSDGTLAVYNACYFFQNEGKGEHKVQPEVPGSGEIASVKKLHAAGTAVSAQHEDCTPPFRGYDSETGQVSVGNIAIGIAAIAFIPGFGCATISTGSDGKCCVVDFTTVDPAVRSWYVQSAATSLSIVRAEAGPSKSELHGMSSNTSRRISISGGYIAAIGSEDGKVLLYDLKGNLLDVRNFGTEVRIVNVEWEVESTEKEISSRLSQTKLPKPFSSSARREIPKTSQPKLPAQFNTPAFRIGRPHDSAAVSPTGRRHTLGSMKIAIESARALADAVDAQVAASVAEGRKNRETSAESDTTVRRGVGQEEARPVRHYDDPNLNLYPGSSSNDPPTEAVPKLVKAASPPKIPPRPIPRAGGKLAMHRAELGRAHGSTQVPVSQKARRKTTGNYSRTRNLVASAAYAKHTRSGDAAESEPFQQAGPSTRNLAKPPTIPKRSPERERAPYRQNSQLSPKHAADSPKAQSATSHTSHSNSTIIDRSAGSRTRKSVRAGPTRVPTIVYPVPAPTQRTTDAQSLASDDTIIEWRPAARLGVGVTLLEDDTATRNQEMQSLRESDVKDSVISPSNQRGLNPGLQAPSLKQNTSKSGAELLHAKPCKCMEGQEKILERIMQLEVKLRDEIRVTREEVIQALKEQRQWLLEAVGKQDEWSRKVDTENRLLREEMARERRAWH